ncbi:hypothetical protein LEP1GSC059_0610 [Leptospira noguchii serovar Panama str. CZ214]|uniref:Uncharacterized protein n=1 Tax=Leptospira noguchii serovar Panama str. CZ214 TaxID=1001595 RepID=T0GSH9_9LEPT|nr:hypothetical protein LEP1GSC059_0610 [Leptospira noguchii serovar Panama str. CZ214]
MNFKKHNVIEFYFSKKSQIKLRNFFILKIDKVLKPKRFRNKL